MKNYIKKPKAALILTLSIMAFFAGSTLAGTLTGIVVNNINYDRIPGVEVWVFQTDSTLAGMDTTTENGVYFLALDEGEYFAVYSKDNYADTTIEDIVITPGGTTVINLVLRFINNCDYIPGDANNSGIFNAIDVTFLIAWLKGGPPPPYSCECRPGWIWWPAVDFDCSCSFNGLEITFIIAHFKYGGAQACPCPDCPPVIWYNGRDR